MTRDLEIRLVFLYLEVVIESSIELLDGDNQRALETTTAEVLKTTYHANNILHIIKWNVPGAHTTGTSYTTPLHLCLACVGLVTSMASVRLVLCLPVFHPHTAFLPSFTVLLFLVPPDFGLPCHVCTWLRHCRWLSVEIM